MTDQPSMQAPAKAMFLVGAHRPSNSATYHRPAHSKRGIPAGSLGHWDSVCELLLRGYPDDRCLIK